MRKAIVIALVGGLVAGSLVAPAAAKKKKKAKPPAQVASELKYYLHWDGDGSMDCDGMIHMNLQDTEDPGSGCEDLTLPAQEPLIAAGQPPKSRDWPADEGLPVVLDTTRKITGEITLRGGGGAQARIDVTLTGTTGGESIVIATGSTQSVNFAVTGQTGPQVLKFEVAPDGAVKGKTFESLVLNTAVRGVTAAAYIDLENPPSFIVVPTLVTS
jgi:hypothetical protein